MSNSMARKFLLSEFYFGTDVGGEDTMEMGRPSGMSTIIKSTPLVVPYFPLKAQALSNLCCTLQTSFRMKLIAELEYFHHEALNSKKGNTFSRKAIISTHSLGKAVCYT
jgi:hypothetical protein